MTPGRAALLTLMHRYLGGMLDPFVTLLEVHKLVYFLQEAGQPQKLRYTKHVYGPYAENLSHVLSAIERHYVSGYANGVDQPEKPLELVPGALEEATAALADDQETAARIARASDLVAGFETSFGLELLASVHWVVQRQGARTARKAVIQVHGWNERKRRFSPRQIALAFRTLNEKGWLAAA